MVDQPMPTQYNTGFTDHSTVIDRSYLGSYQGILKALELVFDLITFICSSVWQQLILNTGGGWVQFVSMSAFVGTVLIYILYMFFIVPKIEATLTLPPAHPWKMWEFIFYAVFTLFYLISGIVAACFGYKHSSIGASAFFTFLCFVLYAIDGIFQFKEWRGLPSFPAGSSASTSRGGETTSPAGTYTAKAGTGPSSDQAPPYEKSTSGGVGLY